MGLQDLIRKRLRPRNDAALQEGSPAANEEPSDFLQSIVDAIEVGIGVVDRKGRLLLSNRAWAEVVGIGATDARFREWPKTYGLYRPDGETLFPSKNMPVSLAIRGETCDEVEMFIRNPQRPEGAHIIATAEPLRDPDGEVNGAVTVLRDVTESRKAAEFLKLQTGILEMTSDFVGFATPDGAFQFVNYAGLKMCGLEADTDVTKLRIPDMHPEWVNQLMNERALPIANETGIWEGEAAFLHRDGHEVPVSMVLLAHKSEDGRVKHYSTISRDITELKRAEEGLRRSEARYRDLFEAAPLATGRVDLSGVHTALEELRAEGVADIREYLKATPEFFAGLPEMVETLDINTAGRRLFGVENRDEFSRELPKLFTPEMMEAFEGITVALWEGRTHFEEEALFSTLHGMRIPTILSLTVAGNPPDYRRGIMTVTDITERKRAEEEIRKLSNVVVQTADIVVITDTGGVIEYVNPAFTSITGYTEEEALGETPRILKSGRHDDAFYQELWGTILSGEIFRGLLTNRRKDGTLYHEEKMITPLHGDAGGITHFVSTGKDVTARIEAEDELASHAQELERSNAELEQFAYVASHDLKEPLRMVSSFLQLLEEKYKGRLGSDADEFIAFAMDGAERMQRQITDLLEYSRVSRLPHDPEAVSCEAVLNQVVANLGDAIKEAGAKIAHGTLPTVSADEILMSRLFQNLIDNAIKFRGTDPPKVDISAEKRGKEWRFAVRDNGIGIDPQHAERVFTIFQRLHPRDAYPGTGIGLAICKKIVERLGGRIWVNSKLDEGSTFYFTLPEREE
ncbi:MAG: PAS domain S-box protein [Candidatus Methylomirabilales bacterium]